MLTRGSRSGSCNGKAHDFLVLQPADESGDLILAHRAIAELQFEHAVLAAIDHGRLIFVQQSRDVRKARAWNEAHQRTWQPYSETTGRGLVGVQRRGLERSRPVAHQDRADYAGL